MREKFVTVTLEVPLKHISFSDCGDGCGRIDGLKNATLDGRTISQFAPSDVLAAENAMYMELGHFGGGGYDLQKEMQAFRDELVSGDIVTANRRAG
ncbi:hypothetical protein [Haliea salexigens]|uniref:hypothetical protein n=1 Tax=Haliea salexigens TaxID=287487 RepID=UPI0004005DC9|nr:hypothetical protein [Haliea salexigens]